MQANKLKDKHDKKQYVNGQRNVWANMRQMERQRDRQTDRQTCSHEIAQVANTYMYKKKRNKHNCNVAARK